jgi:hypothetical protein
METIENFEGNSNIFDKVFEIFPLSYLRKVRSEDYLKKISELIKVSCIKFHDICIPPEAFEFTVKWNELPLNYKIKPEGALRDTLIALMKERMKATEVKKLIKEIKVPRASFYRFLNEEHVSIKNFLKLLGYLNSELEPDEEQLSIVAGNKVIKRNRKRLEELVNSITKDKVEEKLHWFHTHGILLKIPSELWKKIVEIIELKYLNFTLFCNAAKISNSLFQEGYRDKLQAIRTKTLRSILEALSIPPESLKDDEIIPINPKGSPLRKFLSKFEPIVEDIQKIIPKLEAKPEEGILKNIEMNEFVAEEIGIHMGDGMMNVYLNKSNGKKVYLIKISGDPIEDKPYYDFWVKPLIFAGYGKEVKPKLLKWNEYGVRFNSKDIILFKHKLGLPLGEKRNMKIPKEIKENEEFLKRFLRGVFDTDGSITFIREADRIQTIPEIRLGSPDRVFMSEIANALSKFGFDFFQGKGKVSRIAIQGEENVSLFLKEIGLRNLKHLSKWLIYKHYGYCPIHTDLLTRLLILEGKINPKVLLDNHFRLCSTS